MTRVLVTGATGFVGRHLVRHASESGSHVAGLVRTDSADTDGLDQVIVGDLGDDGVAAAAIVHSKPDLVFHLAALASVADSWKRPGETLEQNIRMTTALLEAVREHAPAARVLVACSGEEYGAPPDLPVTEAHPLRPRNPYAVSKAATDLLAGFYADAHGLDIVRTRAFNHAGPLQTDAYVVSAFARQIAQAEAAGRTKLPLKTGDLRPRRDFTDVRDVVRAYWLLGEAAAIDVFNVCSGVSVPAAEILSGLVALTDLTIEQETDPARLRQHEVMDIRGSHDKLTAQTGWLPEIPLARTLSDTLDWWRGQTMPG